MQLARYRTCITRDSLKRYTHASDGTDWEKLQQIRETPEQYFHPTVVLLNAVLKKTTLILILPFLSVPPPRDRSLSYI